MLEFRTMSLPSVMLFVSMKMSGRKAVTPLYCFLGGSGDCPLLCHANGELFKGLLVKKACSQGSNSGWDWLRQDGSGSGDVELGSFYGF